MKKILVTGGGGYVGARLCLHLADQGYSVTPLCYSKIPDDKSWVSKMEHIVVGDVRDEKFLSELALNQYDIVIHLVSLDHNQSNNGSPVQVSAVNITPVWSLLDIFSKQGLTKFIYFSTVQVYGPLRDENITESHKTNTQNAYGLTHDIGEAICEYYNRTSYVDCNVVRLSNSYGAPIFKENNCWWLVVNDLCKMAFYEKKIVLQSDGTPLRNFIHGWDVCNGVQSIIETTEKHPVYNLSSDITLSIMEIAQLIKTVFYNRYGIELSITAAKRTFEGEISKYSLDSSLIKSIGFELQWSLEMGVNDLFDFLEQNNE